MILKTILKFKNKVPVVPLKLIDHNALFRKTLVAMETLKMGIQATLETIVSLVLILYVSCLHEADTTSKQILFSLGLASVTRTTVVNSVLTTCLGFVTFGQVQLPLPNNLVAWDV